MIEHILFYWKYRAQIAEEALEEANEALDQEIKISCTLDGNLSENEIKDLEF